MERLRVASNRNRRSIMKDIDKAYRLINSILHELNPNESKDELKKVDIILWNIMCDEEAHKQAIDNYDSLLSALKEFLRVINRSETALHHYGNAIQMAEQAIKQAEANH